MPPDRRSATRLVDTAVPLTHVPMAAPDEPVPVLLQRMQSAPDGRALVVDSGGRLVGIVSPSDVARYVQVALLGTHGRTTAPG